MDDKVLMAFDKDEVCTSITFSIIFTKYQIQIQPINQHYTCIIVQ